MNPLDQVELEQSVKDMATLAAAFYLTLRTLTVDRRSSVALTAAWIQTRMRQDANS